jgi:thiaminase/transcriptional activator TenA
VSHHETLIKEHADLVDRARRHPFIEQIAAGTLSSDCFLGWLCQNYLWTRNFENFLASLGARAPRSLNRMFCEAMLTLHGEIELFEELCAKTEACLTDCRMNLACDAYANFLTVTVQTRGFEEALVACYAANYVFREGWMYVKQTQREPGPWQDFVELWTHEGFTEWVAHLADFVDRSAEGAEPDTLRRMSERFSMAIQYQIRYWSSVLDGDHS